MEADIDAKSTSDDMRVGYSGDIAYVTLNHKDTVGDVTQVNSMSQP